MQIKRRIITDTKSKIGKRVLKIISESDLNYDIWDSGNILFEIYEDNKLWKELEPLIKNGENIMIEAEYSKEELDNSLWLRIRSKRHYGYPMPDNDFEYMKDLYGLDYKKDCDCHKIQIGEFNIKNEVKWKGNHFFMLNWIFDELFVDSRLRELFYQSELKGFIFKDVYLYNKNIKSNNVSQLFITNKLCDEININKTEYKKIFNCPKCKETKFILTGRNIVYNWDVFKDLDVDIIKSKSNYGDANISSSNIYISQKFYRLLIDNKLDKNLQFQPITFEFHQNKEEDC